MLQVQSTIAETFAWDRLGDLNKAAQRGLEGRDLAPTAAAPTCSGTH